jgi:D-sedoheptulose 7-phosphate isomerase
MPTSNPQDILNANIADAVRTIQDLSEHGEALGRASKLICEALLGGNKLLTCGNGGSAADAGHIAAELVGRFVRERKGYPAISLSDSASAVTAIGNDYGFEKLFARQVEALGRSGDVLLALSTSGNSPNITHALELANRMGLATIAFLGRDGGRARGLATVEFTVRHDASARIQEAHQLLYHSLCQAVDDAIIV